nr:MAG TPA: hypothetical protein [Caudoviricetes sp.]
MAQFRRIVRDGSALWRRDPAEQPDAPSRRAITQDPDGKKGTPRHTRDEAQQHDRSFISKIKFPVSFSLSTRRRSCSAHGYACPRKPSLVRCNTSYNV